uniref:Uncharacterized protein n=1 Tax=Panagrellus redivivus TaxID=6233 RepID=A0A7E4UR17_PANRE
MKRRRSASMTMLLVVVFAVFALAVAEPKTGYDGKVQTVVMNDQGATEMIDHWAQQAYSGLFAAVAAKKLKAVSPEIRVELKKCSKGARDAVAHATCVSRLLKHYDAHGPYQGATIGKSNTFEDAFNQATTTFTASGTTVSPDGTPNVPESAKVQWQGSFGVAADDYEETTESTAVKVFNNRPRRDTRRVVSQSDYTLSSSRNNQRTPLGAVANMILHQLLNAKNKTEAQDWKTAVMRIKAANAKRKAAEKARKLHNTPFSPETGMENMSKYVMQQMQTGNKFGDLDLEKPEDLMKLANDKRMNSHDPVRRMMNLMRDGMKLGYSMFGQNTTKFDEKVLKVASPRFLSVVPEHNEANMTNFLSPSIFSLHDEGEGLEKLSSLPTLLKGFSSADQNEWLNLIIEAAGVNDEAEKLEKTVEDPKAQYEKEIRGKDGQPLYFTKQNVTDRFGDYETRKIELFEKLAASYTPEQKDALNTTGYALLRVDQIELLYGPESPLNDTETYENLMKQAITEGTIESNIHAIATTDHPRRVKRDIVLSPIVFTPLIKAAPILNQWVVLSPLVFSPIVLTPAVLGPIVLSPWVFIPLILSPRVMGPLILSPMIFSPLILSPLVLHPLILTPGIFNPIVLTPLVLSPLILSPQVFTPIILSPLVLNPLILNPMVGSPLVLSPFVLSPLILSPQVLFAVVLSPYALSPLVLSPLAIAEVVLSPSWLS